MADRTPVIDCHFHVWDFKKFSYRFPTSEHGELYRDIPVQEYAENIRDTYVTHAIFMQVESEVAVQETEWILNESDNYPFLKGVVSGFKLDDPKLPSILDRFKDEKRFLGVRNILDYQTDDWILSDEALKGVSLLAERGIPYHCLCNVSKQWQYVPDLISRFPQGKFALDHMGKPVVLDQNKPRWDEWIAEVARYPNVYCKISGQLLSHKGPLTAAEKRGQFTEDDHKFVKTCIEVFGVDRCMFGTDWPVCTLHGVTSVEEFYFIGQTLLSYLTQVERDKIFGGNCVKFYDLDL